MLYDGEDAGRPEYGEVYTGADQMASNIEVFGIMNRGSLAENIIDATGAHIYTID